MYWSDLPAHGRAILCRLKKKKHKRHAIAHEKKNTLYIFKNLYFQYLTLKISKTIRFKISQYQKTFIISNKANCKYVADKRKFQNNFQNSRTFKITTRCNLRGSCQSLARTRKRKRTYSQLHVHACRPELASTET